MSEAICFLRDVASRGAVGGKARGLAKLIAAGFSVPAGFVALPDARDDEIVDAYRVLGAAPVAVRSSAEEEDSETRSYAGQFETFLDVMGERQLAEAVKACRASGSSARVASYRDGDLTLPTRPIPVIVQRMVRPEYAGVAFAAPDGPTVVDGVAGLADPLVSGRVRPSPLPSHVRERIEHVARKVVDCFGGAQDIEWAVEGDRTWLLQVRAMTAPLPEALPDRFRLWTAANVQEAIPRPLTPLSEEFTVANMSRIFEASYAFAGLPHPAEAHVRFVNGRVYMSYSAMASTMSAMPGFRIETLLLMFGDNPQLAPLIAYGPAPKRYFLLRLPATLLRSVAWLLFAERYIERAREVADRFEQHVRSTLVGDPTDAQLLELLRSVQTWDATPIDAMSVSTSMANRLLGTLMSTRAATDHTARVDAAALAVTGDSESLEPVRRLAALAEWLRANPGLPDGSLEVQARLAEFMEVCGFRCEEEAELANPRWIEQPDTVLRLARQLASAPAASLSAVAQPARAAPRLRRPRLHLLAAQARTWQRRRERTRAILSRAGMSLRLLLLAIGRRFCDRKLLNAPDEVCLLLRDEIVSLLDASALETACAERLVAPIAARRARYRRLLALPPSSRLLAELPDGRLVPFAPEPDGEALRGCGASPGRTTGRARVVRDFGEIDRLQPGEILVTRTTDIGWTPLFRVASAVVTEIGAPTSHAAIVARELGLPAVVNIDRVTERVCTGDVLFVDGWAGLVRRVEDDPSTNSAWTGVTSRKADEAIFR
jgi:phosphohistidine swiveling domain-containing protein